MANEFNQPNSGEGLEAVKRRLASDAVEQKVAALAEAFDYGQAGLDLVIEVLKDQSSPIQSVAYLLLKERPEPQVKEPLQEYYRDKIEAPEFDRIVFQLEAIYHLRTCINGIMGFQRALLEGMADDPDEEREFLEEAHKLALNLHQMLNYFRDIIDIEAAIMNSTLGEFNLDELFKYVGNNQRELAQQKNLILSLEMPTNHDEIILYGNCVGLGRVVSTLVDNAIRFTSEGGIKITAEVIKKNFCAQEDTDRREFFNMVKIDVCGDIKDDQSIKYFKEQISKILLEKMGGELIYGNICTTLTIPMSFSA